MKHVYLLRKVLMLLLAACLALPSISQTTLTTTATSANFWSAAGGVIVFGVRNTNPYPIIITDLSNYVPATHAATYTLWYHPTEVTGVPSSITAANGWMQEPVSASINHSGTAGVIPIFSGMTLQIPAGATYRLALVASANGPYYGVAASSGDLFTAGGVELYAQANANSPTYVGPFPSPTTTPRTFYGSLTFQPAAACTAPPIAGTVNSTQNPVCASTNFTLSLANGSGGTGQTYQWQSSADNISWSNIGTDPSLAANQAAATYYRAIVTCSGISDTSDALLVGILSSVSGNFTINSGLPTGSGNFQTFGEAVNHLRCGISGPVTFTVALGSGPYNEQIIIPQIPGASEMNRVTFKGNMAILAANITNANQRAVITLNGADHVVIDSLMIDATAGTYGWGVFFTNRADSNRISNCMITVNNSNTTSSNFGPIVFSNSYTSAVTAGNNGNSDTIMNNSLSGGYYGISLYGNSAAGTPNTYNVVSQNTITDMYSYAVYVLYQGNATISKNDVSRPTRTNSTTTAGVYLSTGSIGTLIEKNRVHNMFDALTSTSTVYGVYVGTTAAQPTRVINNLVYNLGGNGAVYGLYNSGSSNMQAWHNTLAIDDQVATTGAGYGFYQTGAATAIDFRNNLVYVTRSGTGAKRALYFVTTTSAITSNRNVLYINAGSGTNNHLAQWGTPTYTTLADWQGANSGAYDQQSISVDPMFANPGAGDYTPTNPGVNGLGANLGVPDDIMGTQRSNSPDPGAYEFTVAGLDAAITFVSPTAGSTTPGPKTVTVNIANTQTININSISLSYTNGNTVETQTFTGLNIAPGASQQLTFTNPYNLTQTTSLYVYINQVNGIIDNNQENDTTAIRTLCLMLSGAYTINNALPTGGNNFTSFSDAAAQLSCGGVSGPVVMTVASGSGPYNEQVTLLQIPGASATNTVTFKGNLSTLAHNTTDANTRTAFVLNGADHVTIDSLVIDVSAGTYGWGIGLTGRADSNRITNCQIINNTTATTTNFAGIVINGSLTTTATSGNNGNYNMIMNNTIVGGYYGVYMYGSSTAGAQNLANEVRNNIVQEVHGYSIYAIYQSGVVISKNNISRPTRTTSLSGAAGVYLTTGSINSLVEKNRIHNMFDGQTASTSTFYGIYVAADGTAGNENRIENNLVYNIAGDGIQYGIYNSGAAYMLAYHNTISLDNTNSTAGATYGFYQTTSDVGIQFKNNIVTVTRGGSGAKYAIYKNTATTPLVSNHNVLYVNSSGSGAQAIGFQASAQASLTDWQTASGQDSSSVSLDPMYINPGSEVFEPTSSLVNNIGTPVGVLTDIRDSARSATLPDAGAYEFSVLTPGLNVGAETLVTPPQGRGGCYTNSETVTIRIRNTSTSTINFANNPVTVTTNVTGPVSAMLTAVVNSGTLQSDSTLNVVMSQPLDMSAAGVYTFNAYTTLPGDVSAGNDAMLQATRTKVALAAGTASGPAGYCVSTPVNPTLSTLGGGGYSGLQWVQSTSMNGGYTPIAGATTVPYNVATPPTQNMYYRLVASCGAQTDSSNVVAVNYNNPQVTATTAGARCGAGTVTLDATGSNGTTLEWYAEPIGGMPLGSGISFTTPSLTTDSTYYYVTAKIAGGSAGGSAILVTEIDVDATTDRLEIQNVSPGPVDVTGWRVALSNSYTDITSVNANIQTLSGVMNPGDTKSWTDAAAGPNYWGSNILWNPGAVGSFTGWAAIIDNNNNLVDIVFMNWPATNIQNATITIAGNAYTMGTHWSGNGVDITNVPTGQTVTRQGSTDNNNASDFAILAASIGTTNTGMTLPFSGFDCSSQRVAVLARIDDCPVPVTLVYFTGKRDGQANKLEWQTATEANNAGFELQRSADGINYSSLRYVASKAPDGNSVANISYQYYDEHPLAGNNYYRLKQMDKDGRHQLSQTVLIKGDKPGFVQVSSIYPNPATTEVKAVITSPTQEKVKVIVTDISGKHLLQQPVQLKMGDNTLSIPVSNLLAGTYFIKVVCSDGCESTVHKFLKQ